MTFRARVRLLLAAPLLALLAAPAAAAPCCLNLACVELDPTECAAQGGVAGFCLAGQPCGAPSCDGNAIAPLRDLRLVRAGGDVELSWIADPAADRYDVRYVRLKTDVPRAYAELGIATGVPGATPTTIAAARHVGGVAGFAGQVIYYVAYGRCGSASGSCCLADGLSCGVLSRIECTALRGIYRSAATCACECEGVAFPCCLPQGMCTFDFAGCCMAAGGFSYSGPCGLCTCCIAGTCEVVPEFLCGASGGTPMVCTPGSGC